MPIKDKTTKIPNNMPKSGMKNEKIPVSKAAMAKIIEKKEPAVNNSKIKSKKEALNQK